MALAQFAMVEELAFIIMDNLFSKHLVLSTEENLVNFLQSDSSVYGVLELQPMSAYNRLLLHRLAEIYGFAHESVGEGDERHLILERCPESAIPSILVSDILWLYDNNQYDKGQPREQPTDFFRRDDNMKSLQSSTPPATFEERESSYISARERIFGLDEMDEKRTTSRSCKVPVVARRMIAHALGQKEIANPSQATPTENNKNKLIKGLSNIDKHADLSDSAVKKTKELAAVSMTALDNLEGKNRLPRKNTCCNGVSSCERKAQNEETCGTSSKSKSSEISCHERELGRKHMERERTIAAKRIFAHALGLPSTRGKSGVPAPGNLRAETNCK